MPTEVGTPADGNRRGAAHARGPECGAGVEVARVYWRRVKRRVMQILFALGLMLTLAAGTLWVRSFWVEETISIGRSWFDDNGEFAARSVSLGVDRRVFEFGWFWLRTPPAEFPGLKLEAESLGVARRPTAPYRRSPINETLWGKIGFSYRDYMPLAPRVTSRAVTAPSWLVVLACATLVFVSGWPLRNYRRLRVRRLRGLCPACGYDLRGAAHERCPECGAGVEAAQPARV
jgi:hypothetical protein